MGKDYEVIFLISYEVENVKNENEAIEIAEARFRADTHFDYDIDVYPITKE